MSFDPRAMAGHLFRIASFGRNHWTARSSSDLASGAALLTGGDCASTSVETSLTRELENGNVTMATRPSGSIDSSKCCLLDGRSLIGEPYGIRRARAADRRRAKSP